jgi:hypothetical protein
VEVWITGHSLGGALATLMSARLLRAIDEGLRVRLAGLVTFGSPRVGDRHFAAAFRHARQRHGVRAIRVRHQNDAVTEVPPVVLGYHHVGQLVHLEGDAMTVAPAREPALALPNVADHGMKQNYYPKLLSAAARRENARYLACPH